MRRTTLQARNRRSQLVPQGENAAILYTVDWASELNTDTISTSTWTAEDEGTIANEANTNTTASARLSASDPGRYTFTNKIVTAAGDTQERQFIIVVKDNDTNEYGYSYDYGHCR